MKKSLIACCIGIAAAGISTSVLAADVALTYDATLSNSSDASKVEVKSDGRLVKSQTLSTSGGAVSSTETVAGFPRSVEFAVFKDNASGVSELIATIACPVDRGMAMKALNAKGLRDAFTLKFTVDVAARACTSSIAQTESVEQ